MGRAQRGRPSLARYARSSFSRLVRILRTYGDNLQEAPLRGALNLQRLYVELLNIYPTAQPASALLDSEAVDRGVSTKQKNSPPSAPLAGGRAYIGGRFIRHKVPSRTTG